MPYRLVSAKNGKLSTFNLIQSCVECCQSLHDGIYRKTDTNNGNGAQASSLSVAGGRTCSFKNKAGARGGLHVGSVGNQRAAAIHPSRRSALDVSLTLGLHLASQRSAPHPAGARASRSSQPRLRGRPTRAGERRSWPGDSCRSGGVSARSWRTRIAGLPGRREQRAAASSPQASAKDRPATVPPSTRAESPCPASPLSRERAPSFSSDRCYSGWQAAARTGSSAAACPLIAAFAGAVPSISSAASACRV